MSLTPVDPDSPQADNLRHLLNVVSGRARDDAGKMSEPIVKEELAIVEFLTAKNPTKAVAAVSAEAAASGPTRPEGSDENTPVDLLLGLAKTNTGRRAAEEEKRQLLLQQRREREEQRQAQRRLAGGINGAGSLAANPWNYVAPQMPGLDVHQPFGEQNNRRIPRPLQPNEKRDSTGGTSWSPDNPFGFNEGGRDSPSFNTNIIPQQPQQPQFGNNSSGATAQQPINLSPYQDITLPLPSPGDQILAGSGQTDLFQQRTGLEFGSAIGDGFDYSNLGMPQQGMDGFNPFAIAQTGDEGSGSEPGPDDETTFLNYILTKFASSSGENL